jgi:hypothetical protein
MEAPIVIQNLGTSTMSECDFVLSKNRLKMPDHTVLFSINSIPSENNLNVNKPNKMSLPEKESFLVHF